MNKNPSLIKYAAFFGSIQIFKYLYMNGVSLKPSLWMYSIHGNNPDIIHFLEENHVQLTEELCIQLLYESIKCYHNNIANYILLNYINDPNKIKKMIELLGMKNYNYDFLPENLTDPYHFYYLCKYNYFSIVEFLLKDPNMRINARVFDIYHSFFLYDDYI